MKNRNVNTNASVASSPGPHLQTFRGPPSSMEISRRVDSAKTLFVKLKPRSLSAFLLKNRNDSVPARFVIHSPSNSLFFLVHQTVRNDTLLPLRGQYAGSKLHTLRRRGDLFWT